MTRPLDCQYTDLPRASRGLVHAYGDRVFLHSFPYPMTLLARLGSPETRQPLVNALVERLYDYLLAEVASVELGLGPVEQVTRMQVHNPEGVYRGSVLDAGQQVVVVDVARAGILPSARFFEGLCHLLSPEAVRQDHVFMGRRLNERGEVVGVDMAGSKIGGPVAGRLVVIPDPMGATGSSMVRTLDLYREQPGGPPTRFVAVNLIVTPEYLRRVTEAAPDCHVHAIRLDRGLSPEDVLAERPGVRWAEERGLNAEDYIVPGAGGLGELMNNALY